MRFALHPLVPSALERRYDGPMPALRLWRTGRGTLVERLADEARDQGARRRRRLVAAQLDSDPWLARHGRALADYRAMAVSECRMP